MGSSQSSGQIGSGQIARNDSDSGQHNAARAVYAGEKDTGRDSYVSRRLAQNDQSRHMEGRRDETDTARGRRDETDAARGRRDETDAARGRRDETDAARGRRDETDTNVHTHQDTGVYVYKGSDTHAHRGMDDDEGGEEGSKRNFLEWRMKRCRSGASR